MSDQTTPNGGYPLPSSFPLTTNQSKILKVILKQMLTTRKVPPYVVMQAEAGIGQMAVKQAIDSLYSAHHLVLVDQNSRPSLVHPRMLTPNPYHLGLPIAGGFQDGLVVKTFEEWPYDVLPIAELYEPGHLCLEVETNDLTSIGVMQRDLIVVDKLTTPKVGDTVVGVYRNRTAVYGRLVEYTPGCQPVIVSAGLVAPQVGVNDILGVVRSVIRHYPVR